MSCLYAGLLDPDDEACASGKAIQVGGEAEGVVAAYGGDALKTPQGHSVLALGRAPQFINMPSAWLTLKTGLSRW